MPKSIEDIDRQIAALKEQKKRQQAQIAQKKREGLRSCKELIGEEVVNAFDNWTSRQSIRKYLKFRLSIPIQRAVSWKGIGRT